MFPVVVALQSSDGNVLVRDQTLWGVKRKGESIHNQRCIYNTTANNTMGGKGNVSGGRGVAE